MKKEIKVFENRSICASCKGRCCKGFGCHLAPSDVFKGEEPSIEALRELINTQNFAIDYWCGDPREDDDINEFDRVLFLRARNRNEGYTAQFWTMGPCALLTPSGCKLSFEERPTGGKALIPSPDGNCVSEYSKQDCCIDWIPYQNLLLQLEEEVYDLPRPVDTVQKEEESDFLIPIDPVYEEEKQPEPKKKESLLSRILRKIQEPED